MKTYKVLQSTTYGEWVEVKAKSEKLAIKKVDDGDWYYKDIVDSKLILRETTGDVEEVSDE